MGKVTGFLEYKRSDPSKRLPLDRLKDANEIRLAQSDDQVSVQGARCMNCGIPYCSSGVQLNGMTAGCPLHNLIPEWNDLVYKNQWEQAYRRLSRTNPFPEFTARVCPAPCEGSCTEGSILDPVAISSIEYQIIEKAFKEGWVLPKTSKPSGKKVAIVGSGPSGLSAASCLNALGHEVTVYERNDRVGGLLMYGIPNMKLDKDIVERRIDLMRRSGVHFIVNTEVGKDISSKSLVDEYDAVILCGGATKARGIEIEGSSLKGIYFAVDFLKANTKRLLNKEVVSSISASGKHVIIIGGGDTGTDCVATSLRQSCLSVTQFEIMGEPLKERNPITNPWPEWPKKLKVDYGQEEAIAITGKDPREYLISAKKFISNDLGEVKEVHTIRVVWEKDSKGRFGPVEVAHSEQVWKADLVLLAMGFIGPEAHIANELKLELDPRTNYKADYGSFKTNIDRVFTAGDMRRGQSLVVWAIQEGKSVASEVDQFLLNKK